MLVKSRTKRPRIGAIYGVKPGFVAARRARLGGFIVVYDRVKAGLKGPDGLGGRWAVMHEPSERYALVDYLPSARAIMEGVSRAGSLEGARAHADILPEFPPPC